MSNRPLSELERRLWGDPSPPPNRRYQLLVEQFEVARQFASLDSTRQAVERAHNERRISDEVFEERKHAIFAARVGLEERDKRIEAGLGQEHNQLPTPKTTRAPASTAHEKELLTDELDVGLADIKSASMAQLQRYTAISARIAEINRLQRLEMEAQVEEAREDEEDNRLSARRQQEARRRRQRMELFLHDQTPLLAKALHQKQVLIGERLRARTKRQPLFVPLFHIYNKFDEVPPARQQLVSQVPDVNNDLDTDDDDKGESASIISLNQ